MTVRGCATLALLAVVAGGALVLSGVLVRFVFRWNDE